MNVQVTKEAKKFSFLGGILTDDGRYDTKKESDLSGKKAFKKPSKYFDKQQVQFLSTVVTHGK